jgi:hypothetical protein
MVSRNIPEFLQAECQKIVSRGPCYLTTAKKGDFPSLEGRHEAAHLHWLSDFASAMWNYASIDVRTDSKHVAGSVNQGGNQPLLLDANPESQAPQLKACNKTSPCTILTSGLYARRNCYGR